MELFDMVKAAPPPQTISAPGRTSTPSPIPPDSPDAIVIADEDDLLESVHISDEENNLEQNEDNNRRKNSAKRQTDARPLAKQKSEKSALKTPKDIKKQDESKINDATKVDTDEEDNDCDISKPMKTSGLQKTQGKSKEESQTLEANDSDASSDGCPKTLPAPTKTKAQQKMFSDLPDQSASGSQECVQELTVREFCIRVRRLHQSEIDAASASLAKSKFASPLVRKRGRPRKSGDEKKSPSPAKKLKTTTSPPSKIHIKVPLPSEAKKRALANLARTHTPPPILANRLKPRPKPRGRPKGPKASPKMVRRYGKRFFSCVVNVKKLKWPGKSPERNSRPRLGGVHKNRPRRSNLSVSFNESVEILGSNEGGSRRSTFGNIQPTRLQRVDATGNVLEDIAITSNMLLSSSSNSPSASGSRGKGKRRSCNGSPQLRRPHQRIPLSDLASLRLDDEPKADEEDDGEYIVPNELPGMQRPGTPTPKKKKISYTTTISDDDEDEKAHPKKTKDANAPKKELKTTPNSKKVEKSTSLKESVLQNVIIQDKSNEVVKEKEPKEAAVVPAEQEQAAESEKVQKAAAEITNEGKEGAKPETPKPVDISGDKPQEEAGETTVETETGAGEKSIEENGEKNPEEESKKPSIEENGEKNPEEESKAKTEETAADSSETLDMSTLELDESTIQHRDDDKPEKEEAENVETFRELDTPPSQPLPPTTEDNPEDVLEIQTSLEDVRQLHTPFSSQQSTPQANKRVRLESGDSDCSFKSAHEANKDTMPGPVSAEGDVAPASEKDATDAAAGEDKSESEPAAVLATPPPSTPRPVNGCDPATNDGSGITAVYYSPLEAMPTLDDEVLGQLVEPDFQLNSSRHAISRGTLDDIMTALES